MGQASVRPYRLGDAGALVQIFFASVRELARAKYDEAQVRAWAPAVPDPAAWETRMRSNETFVAERDGDLVGFIELEPGGRLAMLYRSPDARGKGVADPLYRAAEARAYDLGTTHIRTEASLLAESFFTARGYVVERRETIERNGVLLPRARMFKTLHRHAD